MSVVPTTNQVHYPESDGEPLAETDVHIDCLIRQRDILKRRYRGQRVYVGSNMFVYFVEGDPKKCVAPDTFVVKDCDPYRRRIFKIWEENSAPHVIIEYTSLSTRRADETTKKEIYAELGVEEYLLYDPLSEYLDPPLQGFRLADNKYEPIQPDADGGIHSQSLGVIFRIEDDELVLRDAVTGAVLPTDAEAEAAEAEAAKADAKAAKADAKAAQAKLDGAINAHQQTQAELDKERASRKAMEEELLQLREASKQKPSDE